MVIRSRYQLSCISNRGRENSVRRINDSHILKLTFPKISPENHYGLLKYQMEYQIDRFNSLSLFDWLERSTEIQILPVPVYCEYNLFSNSFVFLNIRE